MMNYIHNKPYIILGVLIPIILILGFIHPKKMFVINVGDTYFVMQQSHLAVLLSFFYGFLAVIYRGLIKLDFDLNRWLTIVHCIVTVGGLLLIWCLFQFIREIKPGDIEVFLIDSNFNARINWCNFIVFISIVGVQMLFLINIVMSLIKVKMV